MPVFRLSDEIVFPDPRLAEPSGLLAVGGDLSPDRLLFGYEIGVFPWPHRNMPLLWFSPPLRMVLRPEECHISRSLRRTLNQDHFEVRADTAFEDVIDACADPAHREEGFTWINDEMRSAYLELHKLGFAHSIEAWRDGHLVGGLYGVSLGGCFSGESMFFRAPNASKVALVRLAQKLTKWGYPLFDCQVYTAHMARYGATEWPRDDYLASLTQAITQPTRRGQWTEYFR